MKPNTTDRLSETETAREPLLVARMVALLLAGGAVAIVVFWGIGELLGGPGGPWATRDLDRGMVEAFVENRSGALNRFMTTATYAGGAIVLAPVMVLAAIWSFVVTRSVRWPLFFMAVVLGIQGLVRVVKSLVGRLRPELAPLGEVDTPAFPSGHAAAAAACFGALAYFLMRHLPRRWALLAAFGCSLVVLLVGITRVHMAVHWPSDVVGGWLMGAGWLALVVVATRHLAEETQE